jgi:NitT/TauT family transport system ATP-binding protein
MLEVRINAKDFRSGVHEGQVLREISFGVRPGEIVALLGPSGIGKTTILRIALGLDRDFEGSVRMPVGRIGVMFQDPRLLPWLAVGDNLRLVRPPDLPGLDIEALLDEVLLPPVQALRPSALSLGMARRVALARALAVDPSTLVLDEPFASLDQGVAATLGSRLAERARGRRMIVLLSTHDVEQALAMASRLLVLGGQPATLVADIAVPEPNDVAAIGALRANLLGRFRFLAKGD